MSGKKQKSKASDTKTTNGPYTCPECTEVFSTIPQLRSHLASHVPKREKNTETIIKVLKAHGNPMEREALMEQCHAENPSLSKLGAKGYGFYINKLKKEGRVTVRTIVELVK